ncbi:hypothetical protein BDA99DRAFT_99525 [Phascolomyces articulosus]|uniref:Uncharacterized protein n=1 Tax=Phascolomyces articulosus TaxID=60185 RepID=A0AAD5KA97_9FUNG|nr:hypothetical protein BDA99DRAFT_99525 [Phascolomyces articulosus]
MDDHRSRCNVMVVLQIHRHSHSNLRFVIQSPDHDNYTIDHSNSRVSSQPVTQRSPFSQAPPLSAMSPPTLHNVGGNQQLHSGDTISSVAHNNQQQSQQLQWLPQYVPPPHQQVPRSPFPVQQQPVLVDQHGLHPNMTIQQNQPLTQNSSIPLHNQNQRMFFHAHSAPMQSFAQSTPTHEHIPSTSQPITQPTPHPRTPTLPHTLSTSQNEQFMPASPNQSQK